MKLSMVFSFLAMAAVCFATPATETDEIACKWLAALVTIPLLTWQSFPVKQSVVETSNAANKINALSLSLLRSGKRDDCESVHSRFTSLTSPCRIVTSERESKGN